MRLLVLFICVILAAPAIAQVAPEGTATKSPAIDFMAPIRNPRGEPLTSCPEPEPPGAGATAEQVAAWQKKKTTCAAPPSLGEIVAQALYAPETDAQGKAAPIDAKHARNLALAFQIQAARAPLDLREEQKDDIKAALFNAYRGSIVFETCVMIKSPADCAIPPPAK